MNKYFIFLLTLSSIFTQLSACVVMQPNTKTYTVDKSGCVKK